MASLYIASALGKSLSLGEQVSLPLFMIIASKGAAGVTVGDHARRRRTAVAGRAPGGRVQPGPAAIQPEPAAIPAGRTTA